MQNKNLEKRIINTCIERYNGNLAVILIFGSYNTKDFIKGKSDVDLIILFKKKGDLKLDRERDYLYHKEFADIPASIVHFSTIEKYKEHIYEEGSWASWITVICGSKIIYSTKEFKLFQKYLKENPIPNKDLAEYLSHKDNIELEGYISRSQGWPLTKGLFSHFRRKLQILNYLVGNPLEFDYDKCLKNLKEIKEKEELIELSNHYKSRRELKEGKVKNYYSIAYQLTEKIIEKLKNKNKNL